DHRRPQEDKAYENSETKQPVADAAIRRLGRSKVIGTHDELLYLLRFYLRNDRRVGLKLAAIGVGEFLFDAQHFQQSQTGREESSDLTWHPDLVIHTSLLEGCARALREADQKQSRRDGGNNF